MANEGTIASVSHITWEGIEIEIRYDPDFCGAGHRDDLPEHIELQVIKPAGHPLPITETGYRSIFESGEAIAQLGGPETYVKTALNNAMWQDEKAWQESKSQFNQMELEI